MHARTSRLWLLCCLATIPLLAGARGCESEPVDPEPCVCPAIYAPVCGVDGSTYGNECVATCEGVAVAHDGECRDETLCLSSSDCGRGEWCDHSVCLSPCGPGDEACIAVCYGRCASAPTRCLHDGDCRPDEECVYDGGPAPFPGEPGATPGSGPRRGCYSDADCGAGTRCSAAEVCLDPPGCVPGRPCEDVCYGECVDGDEPVTDGDEPVTCACTREWDPVCGVDGNTYGNPCNARCAGVRIAHPGECEATPPPPPPTGICLPRITPPPACHADRDCGPGYECRTDCAPIACHPGEDCDAPCHSYCAPIEPGCICPDIWAPVCGVNGVTYGNDCEAACVGVRIAHPGECHTERPYCFSDEECGRGGYCDHSECLSPCRDDEACIAVCYGQCLPRPTECPSVVCTLACEYGFETGPDGCEVCSCAPAPR
ncbi:MAG: hypothetical protein KF901_27650 [Myxococcales bacterium]|nr:hypothetical protein [Myxococcales bacterium]